MRPEALPFQRLGLQVLERGWLSANNIVFAERPGSPSAVVDTGYVSHAGQTASLVRRLLPGGPARVINTHLHFDHAGRNVTALGEPTFPNARYVVQKQELHDARHPHERSRASYIPAYFEPIADAGQCLLFRGW